MEFTKASLLVSEAGPIDHVRALASRRARMVIEVQGFSGPPEQAVLAARLDHGGAPLGCLVAEEAGVLDALRGGADEAMSWAGIDDSGLNDFIDRLFVRADVRQERERHHGTSVHAEKLAALGTLIAGVGHEINNPLTALSLSVEAARRTVQPILQSAWELRRLAALREPVAPETLATLVATLGRSGRSEPARLLDEMAAASRSIADVVRDLRVFARSDDHEVATVIDLPEVIEQVLRMVGPEVTRHAVVERDYDRHLPPLVLPRNRLSQVLMNILVNAGHAVREVERPIHRVRVTTRMDDDFIALCISDTGPGIPQQAVDRIFDPFFTTKRETLGTGLGLSISRGILRGAGGDLIVESICGEGATFICLLPRPTPEDLAAAYQQRASDRPSHLPPPTGALLVVDEDERVLRACARYLSQTCRIVIARDGREAIDLLSSGSEVDAVLTELDLPEVDGPALHGWLLDHRPELASHMLLMCDTLSLNAERADFVARQNLPMVEKPLESALLTARISELLGSAQGAGYAAAH